MAKLHKLNQKQINEAQRNTPDKDYRLSDGGGLSLHVRTKGSLYWAVQVTVKVSYGRGKRVEVGLGHYPDIDLKGAREAAQVMRTLASDGIDPRQDRKEKRAQQQKFRPTFGQVCELAFEAKKADLKGEGVNGRWMSPLKIHLLPTFGEVPIEEITQHDLVETLKPIWHTKASTASKCLDRSGLAFKHAAAMDLDVSLETVPKARILLGKQRHKSESIPSMPWQEVPHFYASLSEELVSHLALKLLILTGARSSPVRHAHVDQFVDGVWNIPADNMKGGEAFEIPLSSEAQRIVDIASKQSTEQGGRLFMAPHQLNVISDMAMSQLMKGRFLEYRPHGFRSTMRDWLTEETECPYDTREKILAHKVGNRVTQAYDRSKDLKRRAIYMQAWADYVTAKVADVVKLRTA